MATTTVEQQFERVSCYDANDHMVSITPPGFEVLLVHEEGEFLFDTPLVARAETDVALGYHINIAVGLMEDGFNPDQYNLARIFVMVTHDETGVKRCFTAHHGPVGYYPVDYSARNTWGPLSAAIRHGGAIEPLNVGLSVLATLYNYTRDEGIGCGRTASPDQWLSILATESRIVQRITEHALGGHAETGMPDTLWRAEVPDLLRDDGIHELHEDAIELVQANQNELIPWYSVRAARFLHPEVALTQTSEWFAWQNYLQALVVSHKRHEIEIDKVRLLNASCAGESGFGYSLRIDLSVIRGVHEQNIVHYFKQFFKTVDNSLLFRRKKRGGTNGLASEIHTHCLRFEYVNVPEQILFMVFGLLAWREGVQLRLVRYC